MSEVMEWKGDRLLLTLGRDPEAVLVRLFPAKLAPCRIYVPEVKALRLQCENDQLRELVREAVAFVSDEDPCSHCGHDAECYAQNGLNVAYEGGCLMLDLLCDHARELGIEVSE